MKQNINETMLNTSFKQINFMPSFFQTLNNAICTSVLSVNRPRIFKTFIHRACSLLKLYLSQIPLQCTILPNPLPNPQSDNFVPADYFRC